jgi:exodeoxyribonuclease VIII
MIDLECLDGDSDKPALIEISAIMFNIKTGKNLSRFTMLVDPASSVKHGLDVAGETVKWWLTQDRDAVNEVFVSAIQTGLELPFVLERFNNWFQECLKEHDVDHATLWGNGSSADCVWIENAYKAVGAKCPVHFRHYRDVRTMVDLGKSILDIDPKKTMKFVGTAHKGLDDCSHQIKYVSKIYKELERNNG